MHNWHIKVQSDVSTILENLWCFNSTFPVLFFTFLVPSILGAPPFNCPFHLFFLKENPHPHLLYVHHPPHSLPFPSFLPSWFGFLCLSIFSVRICCSSTLFLWKGLLRTLTLEWCLIWVQNIRTLEISCMLLMATVIPLQAIWFFALFCYF